MPRLSERKLQEMLSQIKIHDNEDKDLTIKQAFIDYMTKKVSYRNLSKMYDIPIASLYNYFKKLRSFLGLGPEPQPKSRGRPSMRKQLAAQAVLTGIAKPQQFQQYIGNLTEIIGDYETAAQVFDEVQKLLATTLTQETAQRILNFLNIGRTVASAYWRHAHAAGKPIDQFVSEAMSWYMYKPYLLQEIRSLLDTLISIINYQQELINYYAARSTPMIKYEIDANIALELLDRALLMRILGIPMPKKLPVVFKTYLDRQFYEKLNEVNNFG